MYNLLEFLDGCYYINMDHRTDKNAAMIQHLSSLGIADQFQRFRGVSPKEIGFEPISSTFTHPYPNPHGKFEHIHYSIACSRAHINLIQHAKDTNKRAILILEDDARFYSENGANPIENVYNALKQIKKINDWELLYIGGGIGDKELNFVDENILKTDLPANAYAYIVNHTAYDGFINNRDIIQWSDCFMTMYFKQKYMIYPLTVVEEMVNHTDIMETQCIPNLNFRREAYNKPIRKLY